MLKQGYFEIENFYKKETINSLSQFWLKHWLSEIISYVKHLAKSLVVNIWEKKYLFTISVSNIAYKFYFYMKNRCLMQCYKLITVKFCSDRLLSKNTDDSTSVDKMIFRGSPYRSFLHVSWLHMPYYAIDRIRAKTYGFKLFFLNECSFSSDMFLVNFVSFRVAQLITCNKSRVIGNKSSNVVYRYLFRGIYNGGNLAKFKAGI